MHLRILGAHNLESRETRMESHLVDGMLALDAGSLTRALSFQEQRRVRAILLSHRHYDHVRDLPPLGLAVRDAGVTVEIYAIEDTAEFVRSKLLDGSLYPNFLENPSPERPVFRLNVVEFHKPFAALDYDAVAVPVPHSVPAAGFHLSDGRRSLFYTGDAGRGLSAVWKQVAPDVLLTEVTFGNENEAAALSVGHLTPALLGETLDDFHRGLGYLPRVIVSHMNPSWEQDIRAELKTLSTSLGVEILVGSADMALEL